MRRLLAPLLASLLPACAFYDGPPQASLSGATDGLFPDATAPVVIAFSEPIDPATLKMQIVPYVTDVEGNLADEDADNKTVLEPIVTYNPTDGNFGGKVILADDNKSVSLLPAVPPAAGPQYVLLIEPGLADAAGNATKVRKRLIFGYGVPLECDKPSTFLPGAYFFLVDVDKPIPVQVQLFASIVVDPETGAFQAKFTNADRNPDLGRCDLGCDPKTEVCRTIPQPACVAPSERAGTTDEFPDYVPNDVPPVGFSFPAHGCVVDQPGGNITFVAAPVDVEVQQPAVTLRNTKLLTSFTKGEDGILRASGTLTADEVLLGPISSGRGEGNIVGRSIPADQAPPGIPAPDPKQVE